MSDASSIPNNPEKQFISIEIDSFLGASFAPTDLYLMIADHPVCVVREGSDYTKDKLKQYQGFDHTHFYVDKNGLIDLTQQSVEMAQIVAQYPNATSIQKHAFLKSAFESIGRQLWLGDINATSIKLARDTVHQAVHMVEATPQISLLISYLNTISEDILRHSIAVSFLSALIANSMGWKNKNLLTQISLGGLLHDIGFKSLDPNLWSKDSARLSEEEKKQYESHSSCGSQILSDIPDISEEVIQIVHQHHDTKAHTTYPPARIINAADRLAHMTIATQRNTDPKPFSAALMIILHTHEHEYPSAMIEAFEKLLERCKNEDAPLQ